MSGFCFAGHFFPPIFTLTFHYLIYQWFINALICGGKIWWYQQLRYKMFLLYRIIYYVIKWKNYFSISVSCRRRQRHPTLVLLPGKSHGPRTLVGCSPWGRWESNTTERLHFHFSLSCPGEGSGNHSSVLAWRIPGTGEPGGLLSMKSHRVGHDWSDLAAAAGVLVAQSCLTLQPHEQAPLAKEFSKWEYWSG